MFEDFLDDLFTLEGYYNAHQSVALLAGEGVHLINPLDRSSPVFRRSFDDSSDSRTEGISSSCFVVSGFLG